MTIAIVAEKPSVARDIAKVLGATIPGNGFVHGNGYIVTWAIGHLVALAEPAEIQASWKRWRRDQLPMLPTNWPLKTLKGTTKQFRAVKKILVSSAVDEVICATDAGREGELIFRYIYEHSGCRAPIRRLWISSLTAEAIRNGFKHLQDGTNYEPLYDAARARSRADWLVGMNLSRAYGLTHGKGLSVGRVQTPTLAMIVEREREIRNFVPETYLEIEAEFAPSETVAPNEEPGTYKGTWFDGPTAESLKKLLNFSQELQKAKRLPSDGERAKRIVRRVQKQAANIEVAQSKPRTYPAPLLYDLSELQRHANRLYGFTAKKTLQVAQELYERKKLISYPRTDSRHLSRDIADTLPRVVEKISAPYRDFLPENVGRKPLGKRFVNDAKVSDHHAIIPTAVDPSRKKLTTDQEKIYDLICRRLLMAWMDDHRTRLTTVITRVDSENGTKTDRFHSNGTAIEQVGWKALDIQTKKSANAQDAELPAGLKQGLKRLCQNAKSLKKQTKPPKRLTDATLLSAMESAGKVLDDKEISAAMSERGLGTPATRAAIIETLLKRQFVRRKGKAFEATSKGERLIDVVHPQVKSPQMTGEWEWKLKRIERKEGQFDAFMQDIESYVREVVENVFGDSSTPPDDSEPSLPNLPPPSPTQTKSTPKTMSRAKPKAAQPPETSDLFGTSSHPEEPAWLHDAPPPEWEEIPPPEWENVPSAASEKVPRATEKNQPQRSNETVVAPSLPGFEPQVLEAKNISHDRALHKEASGREPSEILQQLFGHKTFRPHQETVCREVIAGRDVLLVMPTGAGKSLCYQLPGVARGGVTLVVSPLISLMEDQAAKLNEQGFVAERIHSGRSRPQSRQACKDYLSGTLDFLFIAPERLRVPGFPEMLARRKPALVAIDEAHCISHWGHDFRPDYRLLGERLPVLRPTPIIALTATATRIVQEDIVRLLGLEHPLEAIHGFRRTNIAIEVVELPPAERPDAVLRLLEDKDRLPAIVYAPTRKKTEELCDILQSRFKIAAYHAGLPARTRNDVQTKFLDGTLDVVVATVAFGMGIDKANVRTVVHVALPASVEGYYQEIGRAGRDGKPSRAVLYYSYADLRIHQFLHEKSYPPTEALSSVFSRLPNQHALPKDELKERLFMDDDTFQTALEKLWIHGGAWIDPDENVRRGESRWKTTYTEQAEYRRRQLEMMAQFAELPRCRMLQLIRHFGDRGDDQRPCGLCDFCAPESALADTRRPPTGEERRIVSCIIETLEERDNLSTGNLFKRACEGLRTERREFERLLTAMARADLVDIREDSFSKNGREIRFRRACLTMEGRSWNASKVSTLLVTAPSSSGSKTRKKAKTSRSRTKTHRKISTVPVADAPQGLVDLLKQWRLSQARKRRVPAFHILNDRTLEAIAASRAIHEDDLLAVKGVGPTIMKKYGDQILEIIREFSDSSKR